ncbi:YolD-like family protein [Bacillus sp. JJ1503]|uniref:YolD-like family protein n=1 Tax=Bacillus sp. JJ1503 TaxID=3122956 RepID=UPI002FFD6D50
MAIRDRGKMKWQTAFFMPEHVKMLKQIQVENDMQTKPMIDEYEKEEIENKILMAMEFAFHVKVKIWREGFFHEYSGRVCRLDGLNRIIFLEGVDGYIERIKFEDIVGGYVED